MHTRCRGPSLHQRPFRIGPMHGLAVVSLILLCESFRAARRLSAPRRSGSCVTPAMPSCPQRDLDSAARPTARGTDEEAIRLALRGDPRTASCGPGSQEHCATPQSLWRHLCQVSGLRDYFNGGNAAPGAQHDSTLPVRVTQAAIAVETKQRLRSWGCAFLDQRART